MIVNINIFLTFNNPLKVIQLLIRVLEFYPFKYIGSILMEFNLAQKIYKMSGNGDRQPNSQVEAQNTEYAQNNFKAPYQIDEFDKFENAQNEQNNENIEDRNEKKAENERSLNQQNIEGQRQRNLSEKIEQNQESSHQQKQNNISQQLKQKDENSVQASNQIQQKLGNTIHQEQRKIGRQLQHKPQKSQSDIPKVQESLESQHSSKIYQQINNFIIIKEAERERISITYNIFQKYNIQHQSVAESYKLIIKNIYQSIEIKKNYKRNLQNLLKGYFEAYVKTNNDFYDRTLKIKMMETVFQGNKFINIKQELKKGFQQLILVRKSVATDIYKLSNFIESYLIKKTEALFQKYYEAISAQQKKQQQTIQEYWNQQKIFTKLILSINKILKRYAEGKKQKEDIFLWIIKFVNQEKIYRQSLINYGRTVIQMRKAYVYNETQLFKALQMIMNQFKTESRKFYSVNNKQFLFIDDYTSIIEEDSKFQKLCTLTDVDYIVGVLEIHDRKQKIQKLSNENFIKYLSLPFIDKMVGNIKILLNGTYSKSFALSTKNEELVHTISGNLVHYNSENDQCKQRFIVRRLNAKIVGDGVIQFDELIKGIILQNNKIVRLKLKDSDRAQQLICYLNEKEEDRKRQIQLIKTQ